MNAQQAWKSHYTKFRLLRSARDKRVEKTNMHRFTREASLERKLAAAQRRIDALQDRIWQLEAQEHNHDDGNEWEKEYYLRGMHR